MQNKVNNKVNEIENVISDSSILDKVSDFLEYKLLDFTYGTGENMHEIVLKVKYILIVVIVMMLTSYLLRWLKNVVTRNMPVEDKAKFKTVFSFSKWFIYVIVMLVVFDSIGININAIFAASAALLIGIGLALQTFFQDIISGIFILLDQSVRVGDVIEIEGKFGRVEEIKLRTTRVATPDNRVIIIPNHLYLTNSLFNWTQNGQTTREFIEVGVAYGSDVQLVKKLLLEAANKHKDVLKDPEPQVLFTDFGNSSLDFKITFSLNDSFNARFPKSDIRFEIDRLFRAHGVTIPFPQRDIHIINK